MIRFEVVALSFILVLLFSPEPIRSPQPLVLVQALGFRCQTQFGACPIPPTPIGASCFCGNVPGIVVP